MKKERREYIKNCEISEAVTVDLGGYPQKILLESAKAGAPVVLFLHGGPGFPVPFCVGARGCFPQITQEFTAVYWDQLGCGVNNRRIDDSFSIASFSAMTVELIRYLKERFKEEKLFLFGISWGSVLALDAAVAAPNLIDGAVAAGQVLLPPLLSEEFFSAAEASSAPNKVKERLREIRIQTEKTNGDIALISKGARRYTDAYRGAKGGAKSPVKEIFASKDYRFCDALACFSNGYRKNASLMRELSKIDLREKFSRVEIPYTVYGGERDIVTPVKDVAELFAQLKKENLKCVIGAGEGHIPEEAALDIIFAEFRRMASL